MNRVLIDTDILSYYFKGDPAIVPLSEKSAKKSAEIYATLRQSGTTVDDIDLLIAGIAIEYGYTLVTNNDKHFRRIPGLITENWKF
jgi:tRNA(fMet)-specific endonuclease VapC